MKTIMFTGHRDCETDLTALDNIANLYDNCLWIHGGAVGFDIQVENFASSHNIKTEIYRPDYKRFHPKKAALFRNKEMIAACDIVVACYDGRKSGGTFFTINEAKKASKKIILVPAQHHKPTQSV